MSILSKLIKKVVTEVEQKTEAALSRAKQKADSIVADALLFKQKARQEADDLLTQAKLEANEIVTQAQQLRSTTKAEVKAYYNDIAQRVDAFFSGQDELQVLLEEG